MRGNTCFTTVKGLEGSCDLPREAPPLSVCLHPTPHKTLIAPWNIWYHVTTALQQERSPRLDFSAGGRYAVGARQTFRTDANRSGTAGFTCGVVEFAQIYARV